MHSDIIVKKERTCKICRESFEPVGRERICPECKLENEIYKEELRESRK